VTAEMIRYDQFQFKGQQLPLIHDDRGRFVSFGRACQLLGLKQQSEWDRVQRDAAMASRTRVDYDSHNDEATYYMRVDAIPAWLFSVPTDRLPADLRRMHAAFKTELIDAVYDFTTKGVAIKDGTPLVQVLKETGEFVMRLNPSDKMKLAVSSAIESELMRIAGRNGAGEMAVTVASRVQERGLKLKPPAVNAIGQAMAKAYRAKTGREPETFPQTIDGAIRFVKSYRSDDLPMLDRIIDDHMKRRPAK
jgi:hypothetical protein